MVRRRTATEYPSGTLDRADLYLPSALRDIFIAALEEPLVVYEPQFDEAGRILDLRIVFHNPAADDLATPLPADGALASEWYVDLDKLWEAAQAAWEHGTAAPYRFKRDGASRTDGLDAVYEVHTMRLGDFLMQVSNVRTAIEALSAERNVTHAILDAVASSLALYRPIFDPSDELIDMELVWKSGRTDELWGTAALQQDRRVSEQLGDDRMLLDLARRAWTTGTSETLRYPPVDSGAAFDIAEQSMQRVDDFLLECVTDISEQHFLTSKIADQEQLLAATLAAMREAVVVLRPVRDNDGQAIDAIVSYFNAAAEKMYVSPFPGAASDAIGQRLSDIPFEFDEHRAVFHGTIAAANGRASNTLVNNAAADEPALRARQISMSFLPMDDGSVLFLSQDLSDQLEKQLAINQVSVFRDAVIGLIPAPVFVSAMVDGELTILQTNEAARGWINRTLPSPVDALRVKGKPRAVMMDAMRRALDTGRPTSNPLATADLSQPVADFSVRVVHRPLPDGVIFSTLYDVTEEARQFAALREQLRRDPETGLWNRTGLHQIIDALASDADPAFVVAVVRLSRYDDLELAIGAEAALFAAVTTANRIQAAIPGATDLARIDADTFAFVIPRQHSAVRTSRKAAAAAEQASQNIIVDDHTVHLAAAIGLVQSPRHGVDPTELLARARAAALEARRSSAPALVWVPSVGQPSATRSHILADVEQAMAGGEMYTLYQPKISADNRFAGAEALVRWDHPVRGAVPPDDFIPTIENSMLARRFTQYVLRSALSDWVASDMPGPVSVNCPPGLLADPVLPKLVADTLAECNASPSQLMLEVTERNLMAENSAVTATAAKLVADGVRLSIDDFGAGSTSIRHLQQLGVTEVKLDRSYITHIDSDPINQTIARAVVAMAKAMGASIVAEGVETEGEATEAIAAGCTTLQGYHLGQAVTIDVLKSRIDPDGTYRAVRDRQSVAAAPVPPSPAPMAARTSPTGTG